MYMKSVIFGPCSQPNAPSTGTPPLPPRTHHEVHDPPAQPGPQHMPQHMAYAGPPGAPPPAGLEVGSAVQLAQDPSRTGVIRWTGYLPGRPGLIAGVELVSDVCVLYVSNVLFIIVHCYVCRISQ